MSRNASDTREGEPGRETEGRPRSEEAGQAGKAEMLPLVWWEWHLTSAVQGCGSPVQALWIWGHWAVILQLYSSLIPLFLRRHGEAKPDANVCTALGWSLELFLGLLGAGGETSQAGLPIPA